MDACTCVYSSVGTLSLLDAAFDDDSTPITTVLTWMAEDELYEMSQKVYECRNQGFKYAYKVEVWTIGDMKMSRKMNNIRNIEEAQPDWMLVQGPVPSTNLFDAFRFYSRQGQ